MKSNIILIGIVLIVLFSLVSGCGKAPAAGEVIKEIPAETEKTDSAAAEPQEMPKETVNETAKEEPAENVEEQSKEEPKNIVYIEIKNLRFMPADITVPVGTTVVWKHNDLWRTDIKHKITVYYTDKPTVSPILYYGDSFNYTFTKPNKHKYIDPIYKEEMKGTIIVQ